MEFICNCIGVAIIVMAVPIGLMIGLWKGEMMVKDKSAPRERLDMANNKKIELIIMVLEQYENYLSDGFEYYAGKSVRNVLKAIARDILKVIYHVHKMTTIKGKGDKE